MAHAQDLVLSKRVVAGDEAALAVLYERYADLLYAFIYHRLGGSRADAEDVWQETLLAALHALPTYRGDCRLFTWLCGIARHKIADHFRRQSRAMTDVFSDLSEVQLSALLSSAPLPEEVVMRQSTRVYVIEALAMLNDDCRTALVARYADERTVGEVARVLGKTYKATESLLSRARAAFRKALAALEEKT
jgi:RNA polymerase sigma-70 factor (ECF subfamily)